jgi:dUTP pyrophosphatase
MFQPKDLKYVYGSIVGSIDETAIYKQGDKIGQLKFEILDQVTLNKVSDLSETERGSGGFGSSGA